MNNTKKCRGKIVYRKWFGIWLGLVVVLSLAPVQVSVGQGGVPHPSGLAHAPITIVGDTNLTAANGVVQGTGTPTDPYIIANWTISNTQSRTPCIWLENTTVHVVIRNCTLFGNGVFDSGISLVDVGNVTVSKNEVKFAYYGVKIDLSSKLLVSQNTVVDCTLGTYSRGGSSITYQGNHFSSLYGIGLCQGNYYDLTITGNTLIGGGVEFSFIGLTSGENGYNFLPDFSEIQIDSSNTVNGKPIVYWVGQDGGTPDSSAGQVILAACKNVVVRDLNIPGPCVAGVDLYECTNITVQNNKIANSTRCAIFLGNSSKNLITGNTLANITQEAAAAIDMQDAFSNKVTRNTITQAWCRETCYGVRLATSSRNIIAHNTLLGHTASVKAWRQSLDNEVAFNKMTTAGGFCIVVEEGSSVDAHDNACNAPLTPTAMILIGVAIAAGMTVSVLVWVRHRRHRR